MLGGTDQAHRWIGSTSGSQRVRNAKSGTSKSKELPVGQQAADASDGTFWESNYVKLNPI
jgi:hypothetical protein